MPSNRTLPKTPLALAVLNLLNEAPMHPYEMQVKMRERGHERAIRLKPASVYDTVERLVRLGFVEPVETTREGRRPERTVYRLTPKGAEELHSWLRDLVSIPTAQFPEFGAALMFIVGLRSKAEAIQLLQHRLYRMEAEIAAGDALVRAATEQQSVPRIFTIEDEYVQSMRRCEAAWLRGVIKELQEGTLDWPAIADTEWEGGPMA